MDDFDIQLNALPFGSCPAVKREENDEVVFSNIWPSDTFCEHEVTSSQGCISCGPCSYPELTEDHVLPSA